MKNKLSTDTNVSPSWKLITNILYYGFLVLMVFRVIIRLRDRANDQTSSLNEFLLSSALVMFLAWVIINIAFYFKPDWFYKKEEL